jgi:uncharacterized phiE125 gp8 family phage protein
MAAGDLTTRANVKEFLTLGAVTDHDAILDRLITACSEAFRLAVDRDIRTPDTTSYIDTFSGDGGSTLFLAEYPVKAITTLTVDGAAVAERVTSGDGGYILDKESGRVDLDGSVFTEGIDNVAIQYQAGYPAIPPEVEQAVIEMVAHEFKKRDRVGQSSTIVGGESHVYFSRDALLPYAASIVSAYRRFEP